jgi:hypothetical protein
MSIEHIRKDMVRQELLTSYPELYEAMQIFHFELLIAIACVKLKLRNRKGFGASVQVATELLATMTQEPAFSHSLPDGLEPYYESIRFWSYL